MVPHPTDFLRTYSQPSSKSPQKLIPRFFLPENQYSILNYTAWRKWRLWRNGGEVSATSAIPPHVVFVCRGLYISYTIGKSANVIKVNSLVSRSGSVDNRFACFSKVFSKIFLTKRALPKLASLFSTALWKNSFIA